jgi:hypothetical protein
MAVAGDDADINQSSRCSAPFLWLRFCFSLYLGAVLDALTVFAAPASSEASSTTTFIFMLP